jgi:hypothetical protein
MKHGGEESGFMREEKGLTVHKVDYAHKQRRDQKILDESLRTAAMHRIHDCLVPEIQKAFQFRATRIERYIVACYDSATGGHINAHRDNMTKGTAHRRFGVSLDLNSEFEGGDLRFPEFGRQTYKAPAGGAVVFSCSLLHEVTPISGVSVITPVLNESPTVASVVNFARQSPGVSEVIVVDDGSIDGTPELAARAGARVVTSTLLGKGASMEHGVWAAQNDIVLFLDGDLSSLTEDLVSRLTNPILENKADLVKARFSRSAGRVTILTARPLLKDFLPGAKPD